MELLLPIGLIAIFYFLLIRPQQRQRKQMAALQQSVAPGTKVMTTAGMIATVVDIEDDEVVLEVAPGVHSRYVRRAIVNVIQPETPDTEPSTAAATSAADDSAAAHEPVPSAEDRTNGDDHR